MSEDVMAFACGTPTEKIVSKEIMNHRELIEMVTGIDVYETTPEAFRLAHEALGIDIVPRVPLENALDPTPPGEVREVPNTPYKRALTGVYVKDARKNKPPLKQTCAAARQLVNINNWENFPVN
jgi:hypothetical protein